MKINRVVEELEEARKNLYNATKYLNQEEMFIKVDIDRLTEKITEMINKVENI
jgi:hypothetical protein